MEMNTTSTNSVVEAASQSTPYQYQWLEAIAVIGTVLIMLIGMVLVFRHLRSLGQGFGPNSLKSLGIVLFIPLLGLLAILTDFQQETLAALLGTVAGYVLSNTENKSSSSKSKPTAKNEPSSKESLNK